MLHQAGFGDLQLQPRCRQAAVVQRLAQPGQRLPAPHLGGRQVDRDAAAVQALVEPGTRLPAGFAGDPGAQLDDQAAVFHQRDELGRTDRRQAGLVQSHQRLQPDQVAIGQPVERLVPELELAALERTPQPAVELQAALRGLGQRLGVVAVGATAGVLGLVHRRIGVAQQLLDLVAILRVQADADAGLHPDLAAVDLEGALEQLQQLAGDHGGVFLIAQRLQHQDELVAAQPSERVLAPGALRQALGHVAQQPVAAAVAQAVVDGLEVVQVDEHHPDAVLLAPRCGQGLIQPVQHHAAVGELGQRIDMGEQVQIVLGLLLRADVGEDSDQMGRHLLLVVHRRHRGPERLQMAIAVAAADLAGPGALADDLLEQLCEAVAAVPGPVLRAGLRIEPAERLADPVLAPMSGDRREGAVHRDDLPRQIADDDAVLRALQRCGVQAHAFLVLQPALLLAHLCQRIRQIRADLVEQRALLGILARELLADQHQHRVHAAFAGDRNGHRMERAAAGRRVPAQLGAAPGQCDDMLRLQVWIDPDGLPAGRQLAVAGADRHRHQRAVVGAGCGDPGAAEAAVAERDIADALHQLLRLAGPDDGLVDLAEKAVEPAQRGHPLLVALALGHIPADQRHPVQLARQRVGAGLEPAGPTVDLQAVFGPADLAGLQRPAHRRLDPRRGERRQHLLEALPQQLLACGHQPVPAAVDLDVAPFGIEHEGQVRHRLGKGLHVALALLQRLEQRLAQMALAVVQQQQQAHAQADQRRHAHAEACLAPQPLLADRLDDRLHLAHRIVDAALLQIERDQRAIVRRECPMAQGVANAVDRIDEAPGEPAQPVGMRRRGLDALDLRHQLQAADARVLQLGIDPAQVTCIVLVDLMLRVGAGLAQVQPHLRQRAAGQRRVGERLVPEPVAPAEQAQAEHAEQRQGRQHQRGQRSRRGARHRPVHRVAVPRRPASGSPRTGAIWPSSKP
ncbi:hypothetical protein X805_40490 [Sphaerotilus natans subsp. natans DSM 6575]|uniref:Uncharacterized protein n=1 Tax=Sphaerotilus natans subsp. natans DSM 6575 TaxID=1286631 RepID=A0A059KFX7_9BURK|nr:hypothetical protein X805_40490 [Sphaerotilus natans subsp. natans DSM 6575]